MAVDDAVFAMRIKLPLSDCMFSDLWRGELIRAELDSAAASVLNSSQSWQVHFNRKFKWPHEVDSTESIFVVIDGNGSFDEVSVNDQAVPMTQGRSSTVESLLRQQNVLSLVAVLPASMELGDFSMSIDSVALQIFDR